jgi:hypothetical protein
VKHLKAQLCSKHQCGNINYTERRKNKRKNIKCPKSKLIRICLKESLNRGKKDKENLFCDCPSHTLILLACAKSIDMSSPYSAEC